MEAFFISEIFVAYFGSTTCVLHSLRGGQFFREVAVTVCIDKDTDGPYLRAWECEEGDEPAVACFLGEQVQYADIPDLLKERWKP